ncbi:hypothetical protein [Deinococcus aquatilis]|uniref:hypothetical protein n=1 Tax=Deinococcus aquatilis TaxID=519440 RepID=UPI0003758DAD|nr:hypothetical protein [Deinococcus aquatilis]
MEQAREQFHVAPPELEEGGDFLVIGGLPAFELQVIGGGEVRGVGLMVSEDFVFGDVGQLLCPLKRGPEQGFRD